jgi:peroxiredoxin
MYSIRNLIFLFSFLCFTKVGSGQEIADTGMFRINFNTQATVEIRHFNCSDTLFISSHFYNFFPSDYIEGQKQALIDNGTKYISLKIQIPQKVELEISGDLYSNDEKVSTTELMLTCFLIPKDTLIVNINCNNRFPSLPQISYEGKFPQISYYYLNKATFFSGRDLLLQKGILVNTATDLTLFEKSIDSLTNIELDFLNKYDSLNELPDWFKDYESYDLKYLAYSCKINEPGLFRYLYDKEVVPPDNYFSFLDELPLDNSKAVLSIYYFLALQNYFSHIWEPENTIKAPFDSARSTVADLIQFSSYRFSPYISDIFIALLLDMNIEINRINEEEYSMSYNAINDSSLRNYLENRFSQRQLLGEGDVAPYFYLKNENNEYVSLENFKDSIVYICFWTTSCKPCIKEFPKENELVEKFKNNKVKIVSICLFSSEESWRKVTSDNKLTTVNLYAVSNWENILKEGYAISAFPHYVLIDQRGNIIENKTVYPGEEAEEKIRQCLNNE